jgi:hypothetical protein
MKCDQALAKLATGGPFGRWRASRHVAHCPDCAGQAEALRQIIDALSEVPPLTENDRQAWMKAVDYDFYAFIPIPPRSIDVRRVAIAATFIGLAVIAAWRQSVRSAKPRPTVVLHAVDPSSVKQATLRDLDTLQVDASTLSRELDDLLKEVDLLDARRDVEALQLQLASLGGRRDP